jgi:Protein of unknown function (DUF3307)
MHRLGNGNADGGTMTLPQWSASIPMGALVTWMLLLTVKHVIADFFLQNTWMARGKDGKVGWLLPLTVHCLIHGAVAALVIVPLAPKFWFVVVADFVVHFIIDRAKGFCVATFDIGPDDRWFWWLIGIDQALHHLTDFSWALLMASNL